MGRYDADYSARFCYAVEFADKRHYVRHVLDHVPANYFVKFVISKRIWHHAKVVYHVRVCSRIGVYSDGAWILVLSASDVKDLLRR